MRSTQLVKVAPLAVQVKVTVEPGNVEPAAGDRRAGRPLPSLLVVLVLVLVLVVLLDEVLPEPVPVV
jgi:hypothetical protein